MDAREADRLRSFFWIIFFHGPRAAWLIALGYGALTLFAASFQEASLPMLLRDWLMNPGLGQRGDSNLQAWAGQSRLKGMDFPPRCWRFQLLGSGRIATAM